MRVKVRFKRGGPLTPRAFGFVVLPESEVVAGLRRQVSVLSADEERLRRRLKEQNAALDRRKAEARRQHELDDRVKVAARALIAATRAGGSWTTRGAADAAERLERALRGEADE